MLSPRAEQAELFLPEPQTGFTNGLPADEQKKEPINYWQEAINGVDPAHLYEDQASGKREDRPGLAACLKALRPGTRWSYGNWIGLGAIFAT